MIVMKTILVFSVMFLLFGCICGPLGTLGSGNIISEERDVGTFHTISNSGVANIYFTKDSDKITVKAEENIVPLIETGISNGVLTINNSAMTPTKSVEVYVPVRNNIKSIVTSGTGNLQGEDIVLVADNFSVVMSGTGNVHLSLNVKKLVSTMSGTGNLHLDGNATVHRSVMSGMGNLHAFDLITKNTTLVGSGMGNSYLHVTDSLDAILSSMGNLQYKGDPTDVDTQMNGMGKIQKTS